MEKYIADNVDPETTNIDELSRIYLRYVIVLSKLYDYGQLGDFYLNYVKPSLKVA